MSLSRSILPIILVGCFFALSVAVHRPALTAPMQYDSAVAIKANEYLFNFGILEAIKIFRQRPVPMITFYLNYLANGMNPYYFRVANSLLMACTAGAIVLALIYLLEIPSIGVHGTRGTIQNGEHLPGVDFRSSPHNYILGRLYLAKNGVAVGIVLLSCFGILSCDPHRQNSKCRNGVHRLRCHVFPGCGQ